MNEIERQSLWQSYKKTNDNSIKELLVKEYTPLVKGISKGISQKMNIYFEYDDIVGYGLLGLLDAIERYNPESSVKFETYGSKRIRGYIIDSIRQLSWVPRGDIKKKDSINEVYEEISKLYPDLKESEINEIVADKLNITTSMLKKWNEPIKTITSYDAILDDKNNAPLNKLVDSNTLTPEEHILRKELVDILAKALNKLTDNEKRVITLYYYEELKLKEISLIMGVSESRASQLRKRATTKLKTLIPDSYSSLFI